MLRGSSLANLEIMVSRWYLVVPILCGFLLLILVTPIWIRLGIRWRLLDLPAGRKNHLRPMPFSGGLAVATGFIFLLMILKGFCFPPLGPIFLGGLLIFLLGYGDDRYDLPPWFRVVGQIIISLLTALMGVRIQYLTNPFGQMVTLGYWGYPLTVIWLVATINMINLIDGLDGLATGISLIVSASLMLIGLELGQAQAVFLSALLVGVLAGFLPYNFPPARIFLGNSGAYFLGYIIGVISVMGALKGPTVLALAVPVFALGIPVLDTLWAIWRRWRNGAPITVGDSYHLHHLLIMIGLGERDAVLILYGCSLLLGVGSIFLSRATVFFGVLMLFLGIGLLLIALHRLTFIQTATRDGMDQVNPAKKRSKE